MVPSSKAFEQWLGDLLAHLARIDAGALLDRVGLEAMGPVISWKRTPPEAAADHHGHLHRLAPGRPPAARAPSARPARQTRAGSPSSSSNPRWAAEGPRNRSSTVPFLRATTLRPEAGPPRAVIGCLQALGVEDRDPGVGPRCSWQKPGRPSGPADRARSSQPREGSPPCDLPAPDSGSTSISPGVAVARPPGGASGLRRIGAQCAPPAPRRARIMSSSASPSTWAKPGHLAHRSPGRRRHAPLPDCGVLDPGLVDREG